MDCLEQIEAKLAAAPVDDAAKKEKQAKVKKAALNALTAAGIKHRVL